MQNLLKYSKSKELIGMIAAAVLVAAGILIVAMATNNFGDEIEKNQDAQLETMVSNGDLNIASSLERFDDQMKRFTGSDRFREDVAAHESAAGAAQLKQHMQNSFVSNNSYYEAMFLVNNGEVKVSTMDGKSYSIGEKIKDNIYSCTDSFDGGYLALRYDITDRISCYGVIGVKSLYYTAVQQIVAPTDSLMLLEKKTGIFFGQKDGIIIASNKEENINMQEAANLRKAQEEGEEASLTYDKQTGDEARTLRVLAVPAKNLENGVFAISAASDYDVLRALARSTATKLVLGFGLVLAGLVIALLLFLRSRREILEVDKEIEDLKEKNQQMEELNRKTQELAHHRDWRPSVLLPPASLMSSTTC